METESYPCYHCNKNLIGHPKIGIDINRNGKYETFCFSCSKTIITQMSPLIDAELKQLNQALINIKDQYSYSLINYNISREEFLKDGLFLYWLAVIGLPIFIGIISNTIIGLISLPIAWILLTRERNLRVIEFDKTHTLPFPITLKEPTLPSLWSTIHHPISRNIEGNDELSGFQDFPINNYRPIILQRDQNTCQKCGQTKPKGKLEVHHIIPRNYNGNNDPTNLVTLCLSCHDLETWYGHVRVNPREVDPPAGYCEVGTYDLMDDYEAAIFSISELRKVQMYPNLVSDSKPIKSEIITYSPIKPTEQESSNSFGWAIAIVLVLFILFRSCNEYTGDSTQTNSISPTVQVVQSTPLIVKIPQEDTSVVNQVKTNTEKPITNIIHQHENISSKKDKVEHGKKDKKYNKENKSKHPQSDIRFCLQLQDNRAITSCVEKYH